MLDYGKLRKSTKRTGTERFYFCPLSGIHKMGDQSEQPENDNKFTITKRSVASKPINGTQFSFYISRKY